MKLMNGFCSYNYDENHLKFDPKSKLKFKISNYGSISVNYSDDHIQLKKNQKVTEQE